MKTATTYEDRIALIAKLAPKHNRRANMQRATNNYRREFIDIPEITNIYEYTDASKYAEEHYGETYRETIQFDEFNEWEN